MDSRADDLVAMGGESTTHKEMDPKTDKLSMVKEWHGHLRPAVLAVYNAALLSMQSGVRAQIVSEMNRIRERFVSTAEDMTGSELVAMAFGMGAAITSWGAKQDPVVVAADRVSPNLATAFILVQAHQELAFVLIAELTMCYSDEAGIATAMAQIPMPTITAKGVH